MKLYTQGLLAVIASLSLASTVNAAELSHRLLKFTAIDSISPLVTQAQCQSLFADTVVPAPSLLQAHGKRPIVTSDKPVNITKSFQVTSLKSASFNAFSAQYELRRFQGLGVVDFGSASIGVQKVKIGVRNTIDFETQKVTGVMVVGYF